MSEVTTAADQPTQGTEANQGTATEYSQFLGTEPDFSDLSADETPESSAEEGTEEGAEAASDTESEGEQGEGEEAQTTEEWLQDLTQREANLYAQRYPSAWKALNDPDTPEDMKHLLRDKINSDREIATLKAAGQVEDEPTVDEEPFAEPEEAAAQQPTTQVQTDATRSYQEKITAMVAGNVKPELVSALGGQVANLLSSAFGVDFAKLNDPNLPPEAKQELTALKAGIDKFGPELGKALVNGAADLFYTLLPAMLPEITEMVYPGSSESYERQLYATQWESLRGWQNSQGESPYAKLPGYGTKEFNQAATQAATRIAGSPEAFDAMVFTDPKTGKPLPLARQAQMKYQALAKSMMGQKVNPAVVSKAIDKGKQLADNRKMKVAAGRALGSGQSTKTFGTVQDDNDPLAALDAEIARHNDGLRPLSGQKKRRA